MKQKNKKFKKKIAKITFLFTKFRFRKKKKMKFYLKKKKFKNKIFFVSYSKKNKRIFFHNFIKKFMNSCMLNGTRSFSFFYFSFLFKKLFLNLKISPYFAIFSVLRKNKSPFRLLGIRKRGKVVGIPVSLPYLFQYYDVLHFLLRFLRVSKKKKFTSALFTFFSNPQKYFNNNFEQQRITRLKLANTNLRFSKLKRFRYRW